MSFYRCKNMTKGNTLIWHSGNADGRTSIQLRHGDIVQYVKPARGAVIVNLMRKGFKHPMTIKQKDFERNFKWINL